MRVFLVFTLFIFPLSIFGQNEDKFACSKNDKQTVRDYFDNLQENNRILTKIYQTINSPSPKPRLPFCWHSCAVQLVKPQYPKFAKENNIFGRVEVETISDENGKIIYAKAINGNLIFRRNAELAACHSSFRKIIFNEKSIKFRWKLIYNFVN